MESGTSSRRCRSARTRRGSSRRTRPPAERRCWLGVVVHQGGPEKASEPGHDVVRMTLAFVHEDFTPDERAILAPHFTNLDGPGLRADEPARGREGRAVRPLLAHHEVAAAAVPGRVRGGRRGGEHGRAASPARGAAGLYERIFVEYGDDSVAQLGGVHLACEQASQLLAKALEWGRLAAYLEQSTRYMRYDDRPGGRGAPPSRPSWTAPPLHDRYDAFLDDVFGTYGRMYEPIDAVLASASRRSRDDSDFVYRQTIMAKTCDTLRVLLPAGTRSNLGIYATGQSYEQLLMRLAVHPLAEMRDYGDLMLVELRKVIPEFLKRVDVAERGVAWGAYWQETPRARRGAHGRKLAGDVEPEPRGRGQPGRPRSRRRAEGHRRGALRLVRLPDDQLLDGRPRHDARERAEILAASVGERGNRRHKPGRAWERTGYRFDVLCDYGAFRDLQRHRPLTIEWQRLTPQLGYDVPEPRSTRRACAASGSAR